MDIKGTEALVSCQLKCEKLFELISVPNHLLDLEKYNTTIKNACHCENNHLFRTSLVALDFGGEKVDLVCPVVPFVIIYNGYLDVGNPRFILLHSEWPIKTGVQLFQ